MLGQNLPPGVTGKSEKSEFSPEWRNWYEDLCFKENKLRDSHSLLPNVYKIKINLESTSLSRNASLIKHERPWAETFMSLPNCHNIKFKDTTLRYKNVLLIYSEYLRIFASPKWGTGNHTIIT